MLEKLLRREKKDVDPEERIPLEVKVISLGNADIIERDNDMYLKLGPLVQGKGIDIPLEYFSDLKIGSNEVEGDDDFSIIVNRSLFGSYHITATSQSCKQAVLSTHFDREQSERIRRYARIFSHRTYSQP